MKLLVEYLPETTGYTDEIIKGLSTKFKRCGFNLIVPHIVVDATSKAPLSLSGEVIMKLIESDEIPRPPLQENTVYMYCKVGNISQKSHIVGALTEPESAPTSRQVIRMPALLFFEKDYNPEDRININKDIVILSDDDKEMGWYNSKANILWISDIGHYKEYIRDRLTKLLDQIYEFKLSGEIPILPNLTIGIDPEFEVYSSDINTPQEAADRFIPASAIVHDPDRKLEIGHNGHAETGEIRPLPANHPLRLARNIKRTLRKLLRHPSFEDYAICVGGGLRKDLGGHIHFNLENFPPKLITILYDLMANPMKSCMSDNSPRKTNNRMARVNADEPIRRAAHGGVEWRVLPSFIYNDEVCKAVLCTSWVIVKSFYKGEFTLDSYQNVNVEQTLKKLSFYNTYKEHIDNFIRLFMKNHTSMEAKNIRRTWDIISVEAPANVKIRSNVKWVNKYFLPLSIDTTKRITVGIFFSETHQMVTYGKRIPKEIIEELEEFCATHFTNYEHKEATPRNKACEFEIYLPYMWAELKNDKRAFEEFRRLMQSIILKLIKG